MVAQYTVRRCEEKQVFLENNFKFATAVHLNTQALNNSNY